MSLKIVKIMLKYRLREPVLQICLLFILFLISSHLYYFLFYFQFLHRTVGYIILSKESGDCSILTQQFSWNFCSSTIWNRKSPLFSQVSFIKGESIWLTLPDRTRVELMSNFQANCVRANVSFLFSHSLQSLSQRPGYGMGAHATLSYLC